MNLENRVNKESPVKSIARNAFIYGVGSLIGVIMFIGYYINKVYNPKQELKEGVKISDEIYV